MKSFIRVAAATLHTIPIAWDKNRDLISLLLNEARMHDVALVCLPELAITGYGCEDLFLSPAVLQRAMATLQEIIASLGASAEPIPSFCVGLPLAHQGAVYNCVAMVHKGKLIGFQAKQHLASDGVHYEGRQFKPWPAHVAATEEITGVPLGDIFFNFDGIRVGLEICEDAWVASRPGNHLASQGVDIILNPSASHGAFGKIHTRIGLVTEGSRAFNAAYVYANLIGNESGRIIFDGGALIAQNGTLLAREPRLHDGEANLTIADIDLYALRTRQAATSSRTPDPNPSAKEIRSREPLLEPRKPLKDCHSPWIKPTGAAAWELSPNVKFEEFTRMIVRGLYDYMKGAGSNGFVVSLSGGTDSTVVVCLVRYMAAIYQLPTPKILTTLYQSTRHSSETTRSAAEIVAKVCEATHHELDIDDIVQSYIAKIEAALGRTLEWKTDDIALQGVQARGRGPSSWMFANIENKILLTTSNRSEAAVGYASMDGDTCGGLAPLSGIDKDFLRRWLEWVRTEGPMGLFPIPEVLAVTQQAPTAELQPKEYAQTDEKDLMPYPALNFIEAEIVGLKRDPQGVLDALRRTYPQETAMTLKGWVKKFFTLWCRNQWKRERYAPGLHVDDKNLDPRSWCRFPILSGGFEKELREME